ncbi:thioredoxin TrxC [Phenylobacterium sp. LH3H17]|uniref:thioredoxin TrxC n=1 Tax=Phenylobacterium sp. LH3H17 TaxID=2903901 RepID=UPI00273A7253|nr:thioredoxin TrxC [Phenylobacterium sp. LH3H17]
MSDTVADPTATNMVVVACPTDAALNRIPRAKLAQDPLCGRCHNRLFLGKPVELTAANFDKHTLKSDLPVVIDFWAAWCGPCRMMGPNFEAAAARLEPRVRMAKLDTEAESAIAGRYGIRGIPCMIMIAKGREIARLSGAMPTNAIVQWVEQALAGA